MKRTTQQKTQDNNPKLKLKSIKHAYAQYKEDYPKSHLTKNEFNKICLLFFKKCLDEIIRGNSIRLPYIGVLRISKMKRNLNKLQPDWKRTKELWKIDSKSKEEKKLVYHLNEHTNGNYYRFSWLKGQVRNISVYSFIPVRSAKSRLKDAILLENKDYVQW